MGGEATLIEIIKWIRESIRPVVVLLIVSALTLFLPQSWLASIGIEDWLQKYRPWIILFFTGSLVWLGTFPIEDLFYHQKRKSYLNQLTDDEKNILRPFILNAKKTQAFEMNLAIARHLAQQRILVETPTLDVRRHHVFVINGWVFSRLTKHPEVIGIHKISN